VTVAIGVAGDPGGGDDEDRAVPVGGERSVGRGARIARLLAETDGVELVGVCGVPDVSGRSATPDGPGSAGVDGVPRYDRDRLLAVADGLVVATTGETGAEWIRAAADAGVHALATAVPGGSPAALRELDDDCAAAGVRAGVATPLRHAVPARRARERVPGTGEPVGLSVRFGGRLPGVAPDGALGRLGHVVDLVGWLTGREVESVLAEPTGTDATTEGADAATPWTDAIADAAVSLRLAGGVPALLAGTVGDRGPPSVALDVSGTGGVVEADLFAQRLAGSPAAAPDGVDDPLFYGVDPTRAAVERFVRTVAGDPPATPLSAAADALAVVAAASASRSRGVPVAVEET
jgi:predicted dehydrogenase